MITLTRANTLIFMIVLCVALNGCAKMPASLPSLQINVAIEGQDRIRFSGKGAGAGMMMVSSMGAMGIAIGVAIDEGIGKEIHKAFNNNGGSFSVLIENELVQWLSLQCDQSKELLPFICKQANINVIVYRYGFITTSGDDDPIIPELDIGFKLSNESELRLSLKEADMKDAIILLELAKKDGKAVEKSLQIGVQRILQQLETKL